MSRQSCDRLAKRRRHSWEAPLVPPLYPVPGANIPHPSIPKHAHWEPRGPAHACTQPPTCCRKPRSSADPLCNSEPRPQVCACKAGPALRQRPFWLPPSIANTSPRPAPRSQTPRPQHRAGPEGPTKPSAPLGLWGDLRAEVALQRNGPSLSPCCSGSPTGRPKIDMSATM